MIEDDTLYVAVSQSGETFDTLAAVDEIKRKGGAVVGIINVVGSTIARACGRGPREGHPPHAAPPLPLHPPLA